MGLKRVIFQAEVTYPSDDERDLSHLSDNTETAVWLAVRDSGGALTRFTVLSASEDPDPEPEGDGGGVIVRPPGSGDEE
jgi:hypothetical protein